MVDWRWTGYNALILLAAMQAIPQDLYEAADVDGARTLAAVLEHHGPDAAADADLRRHRDLDDRRHAALHRAADVQLRRRTRCSGGTTAAVPDGGDVSRTSRRSPNFEFGYAAAVAWVLFLLIALLSVVNLLLLRRMRSADVRCDR